MGYETRNGHVVRTGLKPPQAKPFQIPPRLNRYVCNDCGGHIITVDRDKGVTPFALNCRATAGCDGDMYSSFYSGVEGDPTYEWRKPTPAEYVAMSEAMRQHINQGGLEIYLIAGATP
jgi:hypothetical protein